MPQRLTQQYGSIRRTSWVHNAQRRSEGPEYFNTIPRVRAAKGRIFDLLATDSEADFQIAYNDPSVCLAENLRPTISGMYLVYCRQ